MIATDDLRRCVSEGIEYVKSQADVREAEVYASWNDNVTVRINYTSDILCNGVHEPKNIAGYGVSVFAAFHSPEGIKTGHGSETADLSLEGVRTALEKARGNAVADPNFKSLPSPPDEKASAESFADPLVMDLDDERAVALGWDTLSGALAEFKGRGFLKSLIVGGDITILKERMAVANTQGVQASDENSCLFASITAMIEEADAKGTGSASATHIARFHPEEAGREAARGAAATVHGRRIQSGEYRVVFGSNAVSMLVSEMIASALSLASIDSGNSPFAGKLGAQVASPILNVYDDGAAQFQPGSRRATCEGLPAGRTDLILQGRLVGFLANHYYAEKLNSKVVKFPPRNGFRFGDAGRDFRRTNSIFATNFIIEGTQEIPSEAIIAGVENGIYIGRLWYLYPVYGLARAYFTGTVVGDSYIIRNGTLAEPLKPNTVRISDNFMSLLRNITAISREKRATRIWDSKEVVVAPEIAVEGIRLENVADFVESL
ncbi:MAG: TldD/PmbA family protein [Deltaproteobacteria bacterium]